MNMRNGFNNERNGLAFIAYKGNEFQIEDINDALNKRCPLDFRVKSQVIKNVKIAKMVYSLFYIGSEPYNKDNIISVNGYKHSEMKDALKHYEEYEINYDAQVHLLTNYLYKDINVRIFKELGNYLDFCSVIYDKQNDELVAGVSTPTSKYTHLYYGYTKENNEIMYSNDKEILSDFCNEVFEMDSNTYVKNGVFYNLNEEVIDKNIIEKEYTKRLKLHN